MKKSLIAAIVALSISSASFAQAPAKTAKKEKAKTEATKHASDTTKKVVKPGHKKDKSATHAKKA